MEEMEGAHAGQRADDAAIVGVHDVATAQRVRAQGGVAAQGRTGLQLAAAFEEAARPTAQEEAAAAVAAEVQRAMKQGTALVQASLEHLFTAEASWDKWVTTSGTIIDGFPTEVQVVTYMSKMSRERQRMCLAQRGVRRKGVQKNAVRNYVAEMANNLWQTKYPARSAS